jgi:hypothetical protein
MEPSRTGVLACLFGEVLLFLAASLLHRGLLANGYEHARAATAESVIGCVLVVGLLVSFFYPGAMRSAALIVQGFALLGVAVGVTMIAIGIGPRTVLDLTLHAIMAAVLVLGLFIARRLRSG